MDSSDQSKDLRAVDLRGILKYVPLFRDHTFVIAVDGSIVDHENLPNILLDIAVLKSLRVNIVLVYGIGSQVEGIAKSKKIEVSDVRGDGPTDDKTIEVTIQASNAVSHKLLSGFSQANIEVAITNTIRAKKRGIIKGIDFEHTGVVDRLDIDRINRLLSLNIIPIVSPIQFNKHGLPLRLTSDLLASELAVSLGASKLIFLTRHSGLGVKGHVARNIPAETLEKYIEENPQYLDDELMPKAQYILKALQGETSRAHIIDGRISGALLSEIFDNVGIGTMVHSNDYQQIRFASSEDYYALSNIMRSGSKTEAVLNLDPEFLKNHIESFFVYEIDGSVIACGRLIEYAEERVIEFASLCVQSFYNGKGVGKKMVEFAELEARKRGYSKICLLTTQALGFFEEKCGYSKGSTDDLGVARRNLYRESARNSKILVKDLGLI